MDSVSTWIPWLLPLGIAFVILWDGRHRASTLVMAVGWTAAEIQGAFDFQAGFRWRAVIGILTVVASCFPGLLCLLKRPIVSRQPQ